MNKDGNSSRLRGDNPISAEDEDVFKRAPVADAFAQEVLALDASEGATVGVFGPWGSGKTSLVSGIQFGKFNPHPGQLLLNFHRLLPLSALLVLLDNRQQRDFEHFGSGEL